MQLTKAMKLLLAMALALCLLLGACAAADSSSSWNPDHTPEDNTWNPENYTTLKKAPASRIECVLPKGLSASVTITDGAIDLLIDAEKTDWATVLADSYQSSTGYAYIDRIIKPLSGAAGQRCMGYSVDRGNPESKLIANLQHDFQLYGANYGNAHQSYRIARYDETARLLQPLEQTDIPHGMITLWYDADGNLLGGEYVLLTIRYTSTNALTVQIPKLAASSITAHVGASANDAALISVHKENGFIRYEVTQNDKLENFSVATAIAAPQIDGVDTSKWVCYYKLPYNSERFLCDMRNAGELGLSTRSAVLGRALASFDQAEQETFTLEWRDEQGVTQQISQLTISTVCGSPAPWLSYVPGWQPVPESRAILEYANPIEPGTKLTYSGETGISHLHIDPAKLPESADYFNANYVIHFQAPEGATAYARAGGNTSNAYGEHTYLAQKTTENLKNGRRQLYEETDEGISLFGQHIRLFDTYHQEGRNLTVFMTNSMPGEFAAEYMVINWYRDINDTEPMLTEYVVYKIDDCVLQHVTTPLTSEDELPSKVTIPAIVIPNDNSAKEMQFVAQLYPQESDNARYYELDLLDKHGKKAHLPANSKIFLPYPDGITFDNAVIQFSLRHLNSAHKTIEEFSEAAGTLHRTPEGLWFSPSSLSPFILEWTGGTHTHKLEYDLNPDDDTSIMQYCRTCDHTAFASLKIDDKHADGLPVVPQVIYSPNWAGEKDLVVVYGLIGEDGYPTDLSDAAPTEPGSYLAFLEGATIGAMDVFFAILPALPAVLPATGDNSWPLALLVLLAAGSCVLLMQLRRRTV